MNLRRRSCDLFVLAMLALAVTCLAGARVKADLDGKTPAARAPATATATFAAGCFWSMEAIFKQLKGVVSATPGYAGGKTVRPSYEQVETGTTGHAETINIVFDPKVISYKDLLEVLLTVRDPTTLNRQGNDKGPEYRSIIFYRNEEQHKNAKEMIAKFTAARVYRAKIVTQLQPFTKFYQAEDEHVDYYKQHPENPYCQSVVAPEIAEFRHKFKAKLKN